MRSIVFVGVHLKHLIYRYFFEEGNRQKLEIVRGVVVGGEAAYRQWHPGVAFQKVCITNRQFNGTARTQADLNNVDLLGQIDLAKLLEEFPVRMLDVERIRFAEWTDAAG